MRYRRLKENEIVRKGDLMWDLYDPIERGDPNLPGGHRAYPVDGRVSLPLPVHEASAKISSYGVAFWRKEEINDPTDPFHGT